MLAITEWGQNAHLETYSLARRAGKSRQESEMMDFRLTLESCLSSSVVFSKRDDDWLILLATIVGEEEAGSASRTTNCDIDPGAGKKEKNILFLL